MGWAQDQPKPPKSKVTLALQILMYILLAAFAAYGLLLLWGSLFSSIL